MPVRLPVWYGKSVRLATIPSRPVPALNHLRATRISSVRGDSLMDLTQVSRREFFKQDATVSQGQADEAFASLVHEQIEDHVQRRFFCAEFLHAAGGGMDAHQQDTKESFPSIEMTISPSRTNLELSASARLRPVPGNSVSTASVTSIRVRPLGHRETLKTEAVPLWFVCHSAPVGVRSQNRLPSARTTWGAEDSQEFSQVRFLRAKASRDRLTSQPARARCAA